MKKTLVLAFAIGWVSIGLASEPAPENLDELLEPIRAQHELPALAGAIIHGDQIVAAGAVGVRQVGSVDRVTLEDTWHLGSCTKAMTATLIARLVEAEKLSWSTTVSDAFPELADEILPAWQGVTLHQLLTHRSGLPEDRVPDAVFFKLRSLEGPIREQRLELVRLVFAKEPASDPGTVMAYSNAGFTIAAAMAETVMDASWEDLLRETIFGPLDMKMAGFGPPGDGQPRGHRGRMPLETGPFADNPPVIGPAGTVHASLRDWARFIELHLAGARGESDFLSPESFEVLHAPFSGGYYAPGWVVAERAWAGGRVLTHSGSNGLWFAVVWIAPERDMAVIVTTNSGGESAAAGADAAVWALIQRFAAMTTAE